MQVRDGAGVEEQGGAAGQPSPRAPAEPRESGIPNQNSCFEGLFVKVSRTYVNILFKRLLVHFVIVNIQTNGSHNGGGRNTCVRVSSISLFPTSV